MVKGLSVGSYGVYVFSERGGQHHLPHAHIKQGRQLVASIFLTTLEIFGNRVRLPKQLLEEIQAAQPALLQLWAELNEND